MANIERLTRLLKVLRAVKRDKKKLRDFDLTHFGEIKPGCGTHLCAVGWGAVDPELRAQGLCLRASDKDTPMAFSVYDEDTILWGWLAVESFFDLNYEDARYLFDSNWYTSARKIDPVIKRLSAFIRAAS